MNKRIGLFTEAAKKKKNGPTTTASYVDIIAAADLTEKLVTLGAKKVALLRKDRLGTTHIEGKMFSVSELKDEHVTWVTARPEHFETRGIYYAAK
ncbi:MAG TPA: hypothetical protein VM029_15170 [Opitutaceae bacterium]|nr:hypothetical protein [Opitutaceae bacterium]